MNEGELSAAALLRDLRRAQGRSLRSAAGELGIAPSFLSRLERGERGVSADVGRKLANYYGVSPDLLALAEGRVPLDILRILQSRPNLLDDLRKTYGAAKGEKQE